MRHLILALLWLALAGALSTSVSAQTENADLATLESLYSSGFRDSDLLFNLALAYERVGAQAHSLLFYRRTQVRLARDPEVIAGLERVRAEVDQNRDGADTILWTVRALDSSLTIQEHEWIVFVLWTIFGVSATAAIVRREQVAFRLSLLVSGAILIVVLGLFVLRQPAYWGHHWGVVLGDGVPLRSGPAESFFSPYDAPYGAEVLVIASDDQWLLISFAAGTQGWVPRATVAMIHE
jgi:hypothetical protein